MSMYQRERGSDGIISMSQWAVPNWDRAHQRRKQLEEEKEEEEASRSSHLHFPQKNLSYSNHLVPIAMPRYEATALTWENERRQSAVHGHGELLDPTPSTKRSWDVQTDNTLESLVRQATFDKQNANRVQQRQTVLTPTSSDVPHSGGKCVQSSTEETMAAPPLRKRTRSDSECYERYVTDSMHAEHGDFSTCGGASATFCRDADTTLMTWPSSESPRSLKTNATNEDLACPDGSEEVHDIKGKADGCCSTKRIRAAITHNQSERRRRDRINQRLKDLQKLVPNGSKSDKASLLDGTIQYLKQLQAQVQLMGSIRTTPQMIMALGMQQQQLQMSLQLARMGMGVGLIDSDSMARCTMQSIARLLHPTSAATSHAFAPPPVLMPSMMPTTRAKEANLSNNASVPLADPFCSFLAQQSMDMDLYSKMITLYCQEVNRTTRHTGKPTQSQRAEGVKENMRKCN